MKKNHTVRWVSCAVLALLALTAASVWEGSAAVSLEGELPEGAYYAATNSFPRNTVVDVTNLENGRTIRVIVAAGLDSPGLLAMLSRNAATAIGLQARGIGRIRMTQPSDPVAYSRFAEEQELSGAPKTPAPAVVSSSVRTARAEDLASSTPEDYFYSTVVNRPESYTPPAAAYPQDVHMEPQPAWIARESGAAPGIAETPYPDAAPLAAPKAAYDSPSTAVPAPEPAQPQPMLTTPDPSPPYRAPSTATATELPPDSVITLEQAEERPPPAASAPKELSPTPPPPQQQAWPTATRDDTYLDPQYFIGPIPQPRRPFQPQEAIAAAPEHTAAPEESMFSVPIINRLERGKRYVQIGAFTRSDTLETAVSRANRSYPMAIQTDGANNAPVYRLLIGPLNAGESAAVLRRVKGNGFPDAFIRAQ
ncbi:MAG: SPOR domain-containing protein [Treponema sp.]|jgi:hypothetical protein|nr:SPOR domain-containing protein [Treponema sp.]